MPLGDMERDPNVEKSLPKHRINRAISRWVDPNKMLTRRFRCEDEKCRRTASSIHHIKSSYRWKRDDSPENLIALCIKHHDRIHAHSTFDNRQIYLDRAKVLIKYNLDGTQILSKESGDRLN